MKREKLILELPLLSDEGAAAVHHFFYELMCAIDDQYYKRVYQYYARQLSKTVSKEGIYQDQTFDSDPPF